MGISETVTENIFRKEYPNLFIEKSNIPTSCGFKSKKGTDEKGYPDFFREDDSFVIIVEAKADDHRKAEADVQWYLANNKIIKDQLGIAVSGQTEADLDVTYYYRNSEARTTIKAPLESTLLDIGSLRKYVRKARYGDTLTDEQLLLTLKDLNNKFQAWGIRDTDRSLFFSGIVIALRDNDFRATYKTRQAPTVADAKQKDGAELESHRLNEAIIDAINNQINQKANTLSKKYSWRDVFSFIKNIDLPLEEYKNLIEDIETKIYHPYSNEEKRDLLGKAYKVFLSRAGKVENKNIILTPDHIKGLMVELARLDVEDVVLDTCTGSGGFLMESLEVLTDLAAGNEARIANIKENQLIGFEIDPVLFALACSNMFLHGDGRTNLLFRSSLLSNTAAGLVNKDSQELLDGIRAKKPNKCIINPPYENNLPIKFAIQAIDYLERNGTLVAIMPSPTLTKNVGGLTEKLLGKARLEFVIKMPPRLFSEQGRTVNTAIFGFTKTKHRPSDEVLFVDMSDDGLVSIQHKGRLDLDGRWPSIRLDTVRAVTNKVEIDKFSEKRTIYQNERLVPYGVPIHRTSKHTLVRLGELFNVEKGSLASSAAEDEGEYDFITASAEWLKCDEYTHNKKAIVLAVAAGGSLGRAHYVSGKFTASNLCLVLTPRDESEYALNLEFYAQYLNAIREQVVSDLADGTSKLTIKEGDLVDYLIEYVPITNQNSFVKDQIRPARVAQKRALALMDKVNASMRELL